MTYIHVTDVNSLTVMMPIGSFVLEMNEAKQVYIVRLIASPQYTLVINRKHANVIYDKLRSLK